VVGVWRDELSPTVTAVTNSARVRNMMQASSVYAPESRVSGHGVSFGVVVRWAEEPYCARNSIPAIGEARRNQTRRTIPRLLDDGVARYFGVSRGSQRRRPAPTPSSQIG